MKYHLPLKVLSFTETSSACGILLILCERMIIRTLFYQKGLEYISHIGHDTFSFDCKIHMKRRLVYSLKLRDISNTVQRIEEMFIWNKIKALPFLITPFVEFWNCFIPCIAQLTNYLDSISSSENSMPRLPLFN